VAEISCQELKEMMDRGEPLRLVDVRTPMERQWARIEPSILLETQEQVDAILAESGDIPVVFYCHHGIRSHGAATWFAQSGLARPVNLAGGIEAWSLEVDPSVPRY
jgi:monothiol glutaredoxin